MQVPYFTVTRKLLRAAAIALLVFFAQSFAQSSSARLSGTISDTAGALIPGVTVSATNRATGVATSVTSDAAGAYNFAKLRPGAYGVSAEMAGFRTQMYTEVELEHASHVRLNFTLPPQTERQR
jgi:hypothetical protein